MISLDDFPFVDPDWPPEPVIERAPRKCRKHEWRRMNEVDWIVGRLPRPTEATAWPLVCDRCPTVKDETRSRRNRNNRSRGKSTSADLAAYLRCQNVEGLNWKWDIQDPAFRIQSKRDAIARSPSAVRQLIEAIPPGDYLRGLYRVAPRARLTTGTVTLLLEEWVAERGWAIPPATLVNAGIPLLTLPLPHFRDLVGRTDGD